MLIRNRNVHLLLDEIHQAYLQIPNFAHFVNGDYAIAGRFPDKSMAALVENKKLGNALLARIRSLREAAPLSSYDSLALDLAAYFVDAMMFPVSPRLEPYYYLPFGITPYELLVEPFWTTLPLFDCSTPENVRKHMALTADYARYVRQVRDRLYEQADRGIYLFSDVILPTCEAINLYGKVEYESHPLSMRRPGSAAVEEQMAAEAGWVREANTCWREIVDFIQSPEYVVRAPKQPGWGQFERGAEYYGFLRRFHLGYDISASKLHDLGLRLLREVEEEQAALRRKLGFECSHAEFIRRLRGNERFFPGSPESLGELMNSIKDRLATPLGELFEERVQTPFAVRRLDPEMEQSLTFGYFQPSYDTAQPGVYFYNASGLEDKCQITTPALLAHELVPGHHFHQSYIFESAAMHPLIKAIVAPACLEGWAEYAAALMSEAGVFDDYDEYGRLENQKFICARLVVDTGLNELGWSMAQARRYMQENTFASEQMAVSETLRYACSLPAQCLPYKYGSLKLLEIRGRFKAARGAAYEAREFHSLVLNAGCIPLPLLERYLEGVLQEDGAQWTA